MIRILCFLFGHDPMWPVNGQYLCRRCLSYRKTGW